MLDVVRACAPRSYLISQLAVAKGLAELLRQLSTRCQHADVARVRVEGRTPDITRSLPRKWLIGAGLTVVGTARITDDSSRDQERQRERSVLIASTERRAAVSTACRARRSNRVRLESCSSADSILDV